MFCDISVELWTLFGILSILPATCVSFSRLDWPVVYFFKFFNFHLFCSLLLFLPFFNFNFFIPPFYSNFYFSHLLMLPATFPRQRLDWPVVGSFILHLFNCSLFNFLPFFLCYLSLCPQQPASPFPDRD